MEIKTMLMKTLFVIFSLTFVASASAEGIRWKPELATPGDYVVINQSPGGKFAHVFRGKRGKYYVIESYHGAVASGEVAFTTFLDRDGNYVKFAYQDGAAFKYSPNDCKRVLGTCTFTETNPEGMRSKRKHVGKATANGFEFQLYDDAGALISKGNMILDERGNAGDGTISSGADTYRYKLIKRVFQ